jgi:hypothetical protein
MTFFPLSLKALAILAIAALAGGALALTRSKSIDSAVLGSEWQCHKTAFVITTCALRTQRQAVPDVTHLSSNLGTSLAQEHAETPLNRP